MKNDRDWEKWVTDNFNQDLKLPEGMMEIIQEANNMLTPEQRETLVLKIGKVQYTFVDRMVHRYAESHPVYSLSDSEKIIRDQISLYEPLFKTGVAFRANQEFIERLGILFCPTPNFHKKYRAFLDN